MDANPMIVTLGTDRLAANRFELLSTNSLDATAQHARRLFQFWWGDAHVLFLPGFQIVDARFLGIQPEGVQTG
jgi:hypothetical protein